MPAALARRRASLLTNPRSGFAETVANVVAFLRACPGGECCCVFARLRLFTMPCISPCIFLCRRRPFMDSNINEPQMALGEHSSPHIFGHAWDQNGAPKWARMGLQNPAPKECTQAVLSEVPKRFLIKYPSQFYNTNSIEIDFFGEVPTAFDAKYQPRSTRSTNRIPTSPSWTQNGAYLGTTWEPILDVLSPPILRPLFLGGNKSPHRDTKNAR